MSDKQLNIGLFGFGVVGEGLYKVLQKTPTLNASIEKIVIKNANKTRNAPAHLFSTDAETILNDEKINVVVEVIDDAAAAFNIVSTALKKGKAVVSASKKMIAENLETLIELQKELNMPFLYEASACASIPVIRNLEEYYDNDLLHGIHGIVNGSTNYILTKMIEDKLDFTEALLQAQQLGFAESNPSLDILGNDAVNKLSILLAHAYGITQHPEKIVFTGIQNIQKKDVQFAEERNYKIKLIAQATRIQNEQVAAFVLPQFVEESSQLYTVQNEYNGVIIESGIADQQFFYGKGAGSFPTASAVLSDIAALRYNYRYEYRKKQHHLNYTLSNQYYLKVYVRFQNEESIKNKFLFIEEIYNSEDKKYIVGVLSIQSLIESNWWKQHGISFILMPHPIVNNFEIKQLKKRSLELTGVRLTL